MRVEFILLLLSPIFLLFIFIEFIRFRKFYSVKDSISNTILALLHQGADALSLIILMPLFYKLHSISIFKIEPLAACEIVFMRGLLREMGVEIDGPTLLRVDNLGAVALAKDRRSCAYI